MVIHSFHPVVSFSIRRFPFPADSLAAYAIHAEIHKARPDVLCAAHCHSLYGRAMCATGRTLDMLTQDFCVFYNDHVVYPYVK